MRLVVDANILIGESLRQRGQALISDPRLELIITEQAWSETLHELDRRIRSIERAAQLASQQAEALRAAALNTANRYVVQPPLSSFMHHERSARRRIPRDPDDWPTIALAMEIGAAIWTQDADFLGCGLPTWTTETLLAHLEDTPDTPQLPAP